MDEHWMLEAAKVARKALCLNARCGTVIVKDGEIIGEGYNAPPLDDISNRMCDSKYDEPVKKNYDRTCCVHAEQRALMDAQKCNPEKLSGSTLYFVRINENGDILKSGMPYCTVCSRWALDLRVKYFTLWHEEGIKLYPTQEYNGLSYQYTSS